MTEGSAGWVVLVYALYLGSAAAGMRFIWLRTVGLPDSRRLILRSLAMAILFAPVTAGMRLAPFLLATVVLVTSDLIFVRPLSATWAVQARALFARDMLLPFLVSWSLLLVIGALVQNAKKNKKQ
jgi:hypothetical protein